MNMKFCIIIIFVFILSLSGIAESAETLPVYKLSVAFDMENSLLKAAAHITFPDDGTRDILTGALRIIAITFNGQPLVPEIKDGVFKISRKGISLTSNWYPSFEGMANWNLKGLLPEGFKAISEADEVDVTGTDKGMEYNFHFPYPLRQIHLVAGSYTEQHESHQGVEINTYFFPEDTSIAGKYVAYAKKYLSLYGELLAPYPYKRFSIVENILPTGYSMPTFTLLGRTVVKLPFIPATSLGHEILHQWFGNYVYEDYKSGNWLEGITSYLSDHLYEEQKGTGWQHRKKILIDYQSYVKQSKEAPLKNFKERTDFASAAIGYGKGAMVFHMLKNLVGEKQ